MEKGHKYLLHFILLTVSIGLLLLLALTSPNHLPSLLLMLPFLLILILIISAFFMILRVLKVAENNERKRFMIAAIAGIVPTLLLVLKSINELTSRDVIVALLFVAIFGFYFNRAEFL